MRNVTSSRAACHLNCIVAVSMGFYGQRSKCMCASKLSLVCVHLLAKFLYLIVWCSFYKNTVWIRFSNTMNSLFKFNFKNKVSGKLKFLFSHYPLQRATKIEVPNILSRWAYACHHSSILCVEMSKICTSCQSLPRLSMVIVKNICMDNVNTLYTQRKY